MIKKIARSPKHKTKTIEQVDEINKILQEVSKKIHVKNESSSQPVIQIAHEETFAQPTIHSSQKVTSEGVIHDAILE